MPGTDSSQEGPKLLRDGMRSPSHCLVSPGLGTSWDPSFHTHSRAQTGHLIPPVCGATERKCLLLEVPPAGVQSTSPILGIRSPTPFLCSVPTMQHAFRKALHPPSASVSPSVRPGQTPPHPKAPLTQTPPSVGRCWELLKGRHRKEWQLYSHHFSEHLDKGCSIAPETEPANNMSSPLSQCQALVCNSTMC